MAELLKEAYSPHFIDSVATRFVLAYPDFNKRQFVADVFDKQWDNKELKARLTHIAQTLCQYLPRDFKQSCEILNQVAPYFSGYEAMFFPAFVELYGLEDYQTSIESLSVLTQYSSAEFAVRPFIVKYPQQMMKQMLLWAADDNVHLRRLASEGCRPRLPWASALPLFKDDPADILPILEQLKDDKCDYVYRSVANNLNDISKDNAHVVVEIAQRWLQESQSVQRQWLVKHACRGLLKSAHPTILSLFGLRSPRHINIDHFQVDQRVIIGKELNFSFSLSSDQPLGRCRIEFVIGFMKKNAQQSNKIFKISEAQINACNKKIAKKFSFKAISTRKYYPGEHQLSIVINGVSMTQKSFMLVAH